MDRPAGANFVLVLPPPPVLARCLQTRTRALTLVVFMLLLLPGAATAQRSEPVRINFVNAELRDVVRTLAGVLGITVVLADVPATRITFSTPNPVPSNEVGAVLDAILESQGLVLVESGPVSQVVRMTAERKPTGGPIRFGKELESPVPIGLVTQIVPLDFMRAEEGVAAVRQVAQPSARVEVVPRQNAVLITDRATNVARYLALLRRLDVRTSGEAGLRTFVYRLKHASADELAGVLGELFGTGAAGGVSQRSRVRSLQDRSLSRTLGHFRNRELEALEARRGTVFPIPRPVGIPGDTTGQGAAGLAGRTTIVPDPAPNSLVIRTAPPNYPVLQETITALDIRPPQVLLEVLIAEISLDRSTQYGIDWTAAGSLAALRSDSVIGGVGLVLPDSLLGKTGDYFLRLVSTGRVDVRATLRAIAARANVRILSTPHILALNNEEARILVGSQVPFSQSTRSGLDVVVDRIIQYRDVGTQLTIIPTINIDGYVTFRILQEVSSLTQQTLAAALGAPIITTREAETSAIVKDRHTIVLGGLIGSERVTTESGIPLLKDIPLLGYLFKSRTSSNLRTELAVFVTPYVVYSDEHAAELLERERARLPESQPDLNRVLPPNPVTPPVSSPPPPPGSV
ncbi:MAG TPA: secretin N-terminal domain-containing protein [bacterium]|nr:secretin N-terminal domain-containing protein [bacterium]